MRAPSHDVFEPLYFTSDDSNRERKIVPFHDITGRFNVPHNVDFREHHYLPNVMNPERPAMLPSIKESKGIIEEGPEGEINKKERKSLLLCILVSLFAVQTVNMNVSTIVPNYVNGNHNKLTEFMVALIVT